jgi:undecaprenyl pyrophosphate synthase
MAMTTRAPAGHKKTIHRLRRLTQILDDRGDSERTLFAVRFGNIHPMDRLSGRLLRLLDRAIVEFLTFETTPITSRLIFGPENSPIVSADTERAD